MKTLIINPPAPAGFERSGRWPSKSTGGACQEPLFLAYAAAVLEKAGLEVELIDCRPEYIDLEKLKEKVTAEVGLIIIQTSTPSINLDLAAARALKEKNFQAKIALVGPHPTIFDRQILEENNFINIILRGEYDYTARDLASAINTGRDFSAIKGITYRRGNEIKKNSDADYITDLDNLPLPARHFLPLDKYFEPLFVGRPTLRLISSRGCPFHCTFCAWPQLMYGHAFRARDPLKVVDEIEYLKNKNKIKEYYFDDDTFTINPPRVMAICQEIIKRKINLPFECLARVNTVSPEMLEIMGQAGCRVIRYGVESANPEILKNINKQITPEQIIAAFKNTKKAGIKTHATVMFGLPGESKETIKETIDFVLKIDPDYAQFPVAVPYPGTEFYNLAKTKGWLKSDNWEDYHSERAIVEYPGLSRQEIEAASKLAYKKFYLRPSYVIKKMIQAGSVGEWTQLFKSGITLLKNL